jgi:hypothetical protein
MYDSSNIRMGLVLLVKDLSYPILLEEQATSRRKEEIS